MKLILIFILSSITNCAQIESTSDSPLSQLSEATLDLAVFVDQTFIDRLNSTGIDEIKFLRYALRTIDLRFNEPAIKSDLFAKLNFRVVYYEVMLSFWESLGGQLNANMALARVRSYSTRSRNLSIYDWSYSLFLTGLNFATKSKSDTDRRRTDVLGVAIVNIVCTGAALIEMTSFDDWWVLIHEVGHSFGALHDAISNDCDDAQSIMSSVVSNEKTYWSPCTLTMFRERLTSSNTRDCVTRTNRKGEQLTQFDMPTELPGQVFTNQDICRIGKSINAQFVAHESCRSIVCRLKWFQWTTLALPEGTPCGDGYICCAGDCVSIADCHRFLGLSN